MHQIQHYMKNIHKDRQFNMSTHIVADWFVQFKY